MDLTAKLHELDTHSVSMDKEILEQSTYYEKRIYDLEQLIDIAKSFCSTLDFSNLLESIVYICMAQMHVLGAEIFVRDPITNDVLNLETAKAMSTGAKLSIPVSSSICSFLLEAAKPVTFAELKEKAVIIKKGKKIFHKIEA